MIYQNIVQLGQVEFTNTQKLNHKQWLELRTKGIGGSDAGAIMNLNEYATPLSVYLAKKDLSNFQGNKATEWGNILEVPIRQKAAEDLGVQIENVPGMFTNKKNNFMNANLDGIFFADEKITIGSEEIEGLCGHEIKTSRNGLGFGEGEIPDSYYAQVQHYMAVTGLFKFVLTVFIFETYELRHYVIRRNDEFIENMILAERDFWENNILKNEPPAPSGNKNESELVKNLPLAENIELPQEFSELLNKKAEIDKQISELEKQSDVIKEQVILKMYELSDNQDFEKTTATCDGWKITYNKQVRKSIDTDLLKKAGLYETYAKENVSKVFRTSKQK